MKADLTQIPAAPHLQLLTTLLLHAPCRYPLFMVLQAISNP